MQFIKLIFVGLVIGIANVIPGVSGGTMAVVFNIYDRFIDVLTLNVKKLLANWKFILPLLLGAAVGILFFSKVITLLFTKYPDQTNFFFTGLILGSIPMLYGFIIKKEKKIPSVSTIICTIAGLALILLFSYFQEKQGSAASTLMGTLPQITVSLVLRLFFGGVLSAIAMIIPGISGSFLMLMLGIYPIVIAAIASILNTSTFVSALLILLPCGIGIILGLLFGAKAIRALLKHFPEQTYGVILGLIIGSVFLMFPGFSSFSSVLKTIVSILCTVAGFCVVFFSSKNE